MKSSEVSASIRVKIKIGRGDFEMDQVVNADFLASRSVVVVNAKLIEGDFELLSRS